MVVLRSFHFLGLSTSYRYIQLPIPPPSLSFSFCLGRQGFSPLSQLSRQPANISP